MSAIWITWAGSTWVRKCSTRMSSMRILPLFLLRSLLMSLRILLISVLKMLWWNIPTTRKSFVVVVILAPSFFLKKFLLFRLLCFMILIRSLSTYYFLLKWTFKIALLQDLRFYILQWQTKIIIVSFKSKNLFWLAVINNQNSLLGTKKIIMTLCTILNNYWQGIWCWWW